MSQIVRHGDASLGLVVPISRAVARPAAPARPSADTAVLADAARAIDAVRVLGNLSSLLRALPR